MKIIPESGAENKHSLTNAPYFDVTSPVTIPYGDAAKWRAIDAYREFKEKKRLAALRRQEQINTRAFQTSLSIKKRAVVDGRYEVTIHSDLVRVRAYALPYQRDGKTEFDSSIRGKVVGFSRKSRKRLIELMASTRFDGDMVFLTLTYPDEFPASTETWLNHFEAFRRRLERMSRRINVIWRKEPKERKSGQSQGKVAPHYHLILYIPPDFDKNTVLMPDGRCVVNNSDVRLNPDSRRQHNELSELLEGWALAHWSEIVGSGDDRHSTHGAHCAPVRSKKHAYYYASKYLAKEDNDEFEIGRRWGTIGNFDTSAFVTTWLEKSEYIEFRRLVSRLMKARGSRYWRRFSRMSPDVGCTVFGLGDATCRLWQDGFESTVLRMLMIVQHSSANYLKYSPGMEIQ